MKNILAHIIALFTLLSGAIAQEKIAQAAPGVYYGKNIVQKNVLSTTEVESKLIKANNLTGKVKGQVSEVCKMSGCYLVLHMPNSRKMTVRFKDAAFKVPKDLAGKNVILEGTFSKNAKNELQMIADAVLVTK